MVKSSDRRLVMFGSIFCISLSIGVALNALIMFQAVAPDWVLVSYVALLTALISGIPFAVYTLHGLWGQIKLPDLLEINPIDNALTSTGYVYLIKSSTGLYKIGRTVNPDDRIETFTVKLPFHVEYDHLIPCNNRFSAERTMHQLFRHVRKDGEWFALSASDVAFIKSIKHL